MLSVARSRYSLLSRFVFLAVNAGGLLFGFIYNHQTPDLYENNAHHKIGWIITAVVTAQAALALIFAYAGRGKADAAVVTFENAPFLPVRTEDTADAQHLYHHHQECRWSGDSGQGTERNSSSLRSCPVSPTSEVADDEYDDGFEKPERNLPHESAVSRPWIRGTFMDRFLASRVPGMLSSRALRILNFVYNVLDRIILPFGFVAIATGGVTYGGIMVRHLLSSILPAFRLDVTEH